MAGPDYAAPDYTGPDYTGPDYGGLIQPDRVHGSLYTDPRVFADELARIWYRTWVYVGHESEVPATRRRLRRLEQTRTF